ncbi:glycosyl transferase family 2 [Polaribacter reichenbachii]|uniref:Glycosyl transferase family 2 n=1 Tax=Polaribacter reichenbachii TaxID=996801 RepID=A0A1B8TQC1_9FLAO|nr:glycosyltransferase [Polaribacter reichenbachii]APZ46823.1 glycosyl transferase family 2 [Polaribacter reichenbachii]AUC17466.1 glycosyl transferase family 2 [Polaribacter reichenbachii]OBY61658.1 glycosyl transferase family 2 [Polaribacter reichenbachii]
MIISVVFYTFVVFTAIQVIYYLVFSNFLSAKKNRKKLTEQDPVSVIIFAKNCAKELQENLPFILSQKYSKLEILLLNNASSDNTAEVIETFKKENENIKILDIENNEAFWGNKKYALTLGIKAAKYEHLLFSEANCKPTSDTWIAEMSKEFTPKKSIVLGYSKYANKSSLLNFFIRFENLLSAIQCFSFTKLGAPFMAFGDNLAYKKSEFFKVKGFINHLKIKNDNGDLFIKDASTPNNTAFTISQNCFIESNVTYSFGKWFQKLRIKNTIQKQYKFKNRFLLNFFNFSKLIFYVLGTILFFYYSWQIMLPIVLTYFIVQFIVIGVSAKKLKEPYIIFLLPFLEIGLLLIQISIFSANLISKPNHWK